MTKSSIMIPKQIQDLMTQHAQLVDPEECAGLLAGPKSLIVTACFPMINVDKDPLHSYNAWPELLAHVYEQLSLWGIQPVACYHSHPTTELEPSKSDLMFAFFKELAYVIVNKKAVRAWYIHDKWIKEYNIKETSNEV